MLKEKRNKILGMLLLFCISLSLNGVNVKASVDINKNSNINGKNNSSQIDPGIINKEINQWTSTDVYNYSDLVLYNNKVYFAYKTMQGLIPEDGKDWSLKADLNIYRSNNSQSLSLYDNSSLSRDSVAKIIAYNAALSTSKYQFAVGSVLPGTWTAQVNSVIQYDNGKHTIIKNDFFANNIFLPLKQQVRNYFFNRITKVTVILSGQYNGNALASKGMTMYP